MVIEQGDVVWVELGRPRGSEPGGRRPALVMQHDRFNRSKISTTVVVAITSNIRLASSPGNVRLRKGEAGLQRPSVINVTQVATIDRGQILAKSGRLARERVAEAWSGIRLLLDPS